MAWTRRIAKVIDHTKVNTGTQTNFTIPLSFTDAELKTIANGGLVTDAQGDDIALFSDAACTTMLKFQRIFYSATAGSWIAWVKIPSLSSAVDTTVYLGYANSSVSTDQQDKANAWDASTLAFYNGGDGTTIDLTDHSGSFALTNTGATAGAGLIGGAFSLNGTSQYLERSASAPVTTYAATFFALFKPSAAVSANRTIVGVNQRASATAVAMQIRARATDAVRAVVGGATDTTSANSVLDTTNWHSASAVFTSDTARRLCVDGAAAIVGTASASTTAVVDDVSIGAALVSSAATFFFAGLINCCIVSTGSRADSWNITLDAATRGIATFSSQGAAAAVGNTSPVAAITTPAATAIVTQGSSTSFAGTGTDAEDGTLSGASLVWTSSKDGAIGTGVSFSTSSLTLGTHTITLTVTDSGAATGTATRLVTVVPSVLQDVIAAIGTSRISALYHVSTQLASSGSNLTSLDDVRGTTGYGPQLVPNGGLGGTAPTIDGNGSIVTDGAASFVANAAASAKFPINGTARTLVFWGEMTGTPTEWGGLVDSLTAPSEKEVWGSSGGLQRIIGPPVIVAKAQPGAGVRSLFLQTNNNQYQFVTPQPANEVTIRNEWVGRGPAASVPATNFVSPSTVVKTDPTYTTTNGFLSLGRSGANYGVMKIRGVMVLTGHMTTADRAAIETLVASSSLGDSVSLYGASGSTGMIICVGDSLTEGAKATTLTFTTPADSTATTYPGHLQRLLNAAGRAVDVVPWGLGAQGLTTMGFVQSGQLTSWMQDCEAFLSPARRAAGLKELIVLMWGSNDVAHFTRTGTALYADVTTIVAEIHAAGSKCLVTTILPRNNLLNSSKETERLAYNVLVRANSAGADGIVDFTAVNDGGVSPFADPTYPDSVVTTNATYYDADGTHLNDNGTTLKGYQMVAQAVHAAAASVLWRVAPLSTPMSGGFFTGSL